MKLPAAYRAIEILERRAAARLAALHARLVDVHAGRNELVERSARAKRSLHAKSTWTGFDCIIQTSYVQWAATLAASLAQAQRATLARGASIVKEKKRWAACRRGLLRRATRISGVTAWPA